MMSSLPRQYLGKVVGGIETTRQRRVLMATNRVKVGKTMFALKTTIEEEMLYHIWDDKTPKEA